MIHTWVAIERLRFDPIEAERELGEEPTQEFALHRRPSQTSWFDWLDIPNVGDLDEGCLPAILLLVLFVPGAMILMTVAAAPALMAELFLDAFIVTALYRRLRAAQEEHWPGTALRKTWVPALVTTGALANGGWGLEQMAPGAPSIGKAIHQLRGEAARP